MSSERPREPEGDPLRSARSRNATRFQTSVRGLIVAVACFGAITWAVRSLWESRHPSVGAARGLEARKPSDRARATRELMATGVDDPGVATPSLIAALRDPAAEVRAGAAEALGVIAGHVIQNGPPGDVPRTATTALVRSLQDPDPAVRIAAINALQRIVSTPGPAGAIDLPAVVVAFAATLGDRDDEVRLLALDQLLRCPALRPAEPPSALLAALEDRSVRIRAAAVTTLALFAGPLDPWLPLLLRGLEYEQREVRNACSVAFGRRPPAFSADAIPTLVAALASRTRMVRFSAANALEPYARDPRVGAALIPALLALLRDPTGSDGGDPAHLWAHMTRQAAEMLGRLAPGTESAGEVVAALAEAVRSGDVMRRQAALAALVAFGPGAEPAIPALVQTLRELPVGNDGRSTFEGSLIARTLTKIAPGTKSAGDVIAALTEVVRSDDPTRRAWAADALGEFGPGAEPAIPALIQALRQPLPEKRGRPSDGSSAARALGRIAPGTKSAEAALTALSEALDSHRLDVRSGAMQALPSFGVEAERALLILRAWRDDPRNELRWLAKSVVTAIERAGSGKTGRGPEPATQAGGRGTP